MLQHIRSASQQNLRLLSPQPVWLVSQQAPLLQIWLALQQSPPRPMLSTQQVWPALQQVGPLQQV
jgi:hypothetical protein